MAAWSLAGFTVLMLVPALLLAGLDASRMGVARIVFYGILGLAVVVYAGAGCLIVGRPGIGQHDWPVSCTRPWNPPTYRCGPASATEAGCGRLRRHPGPGRARHHQSSLRTVLPTDWKSRRTALLSVCSGGGGGRESNPPALQCSAHQF